MSEVFVRLTFVEGGSITFLGEPFESEDVTGVFSYRLAAVKLPGQPDGVYTLLAPATIPNEGLLEIQLLPSDDNTDLAVNGRVKIKKLSADVVGWIIRPNIYHARRLETLCKFPEKDPLKEFPAKTVLDWVLGDDPF